MWNVEAMGIWIHSFQIWLCVIYFKDDICNDISFFAPMDGLHLISSDIFSIKFCECFPMKANNPIPISIRGVSY